jgi:hypothetical protein
VADTAGNTAECTATSQVNGAGTQLVANPSFESFVNDDSGVPRPTDWQWFNTRVRPYYARTGSLSLGMNGYDLSTFPDPYALCYASQVVAIPANATSAALRYALTTYSAYPDGLPHDMFQIQIRDAAGSAVLATPVTWSDADWPAGYYGNVDLTAFAGQTITVWIQSTQRSRATGRRSGSMTSRSRYRRTRTWSL